MPACLVLVLAGCQQSPPREASTLVMQQRVAFPGMAPDHAAADEGCDVTRRLADDIQYYARPHFSRIAVADTVSAKTPGKALYVEVLDFSGGGRKIAVEGMLWDNGVEVGSFIAQDTAWRSTSGCMALTSVSRVLGKRIAHWLAAPTRNARLGPLR